MSTATITIDNKLVGVSCSCSGKTRL